MSDTLLRVSSLQGLLSTPVSLDLQAGETLSITGASGSGKTRLLRAIADLEAFDADIWLAGRERGSFAADQWRRQVCFVAAETAWWTDLVGDHFPQPCNLQWLEALGLPQASLDWTVARLSTGEKQRLSLLRTLSLQPSVLLLDEPTANLDPESAAKVEQLLQEYLQFHPAAMLWVSHDKAQRSRVASRQMTLYEHHWEIL